MCSFYLNTTETGVWYLHTHFLSSFVQKHTKLGGSILPVMICRKDPRQARTRILWCCRLLLARHPLLSCSIMFVYSYLGTLIHPICSINSEETPVIFFHNWNTLSLFFMLAFDFLMCFFGLLEGAPFDVEKFDEFFRMVSAVHEDGRWKVKATRHPRGEQFEHYLEWVAFIRICTNTGLCWPYQYENDDICVENSLKLKKIHRSIHIWYKVPSTPDSKGHSTALSRHFFFFFPAVEDDDEFRLMTTSAFNVQ